LRVDGVFGPGTESAVRDFQKFAGIPIDGVVGPRTWAALLAPARIPAPNLKKFQAALGTAEDFVEHVRKLEGVHRDPAALFDALSDFTGTAKGARYLLTARAPGVIDFRHFFAAAAEAYCGSRSRKAGLPSGGGRGNTLLLGVGNELAQCVDEGLRSKMNSCFAREDLGSNRLGAEFGRLITIRRAEASRESVSQHLRRFLARETPQPPKAIGDAELSSPVQVMFESVGAIVTGILDALVPDAY
jgi:hypothetical protein